jgi:broad specificity phosphatase PhoE
MTGSDTRPRTILLVRHAAVAVDRTRPAAEWQLSSAGLEAAERLARARAWRDVRLVATSPEPKARATAGPLAAAAGVGPVVDPRLREVEGRAWVDDCERAVAEYFATGERPGWEPAVRATARIRDALDALPGDACAVSHGLVLSLAVADLTGRPPDIVAWRAVPFPAVAVVRNRTATPFVSVEEFLSH